MDETAIIFVHVDASDGSKLLTLLTQIIMLLFMLTRQTDIHF